MNTPRLQTPAQRLSSMVLATLFTAAMLIGIDTLTLTEASTPWIAQHSMATA